MSQKIAVALIHGIGNQKTDYADHAIETITKEFSIKIAKYTSEPDKQLVFDAIYWASVFDEEEDLLWERMQTGGDMDFAALRRFMVSYLSSAVAYQPTLTHQQNYDRVHGRVADAFKRLAASAGSKAPLAIIAHSLGSVIAHNYIYDMQFKRQELTPSVMNVVEPEPSPLEEMKTFSQFFTLGSSLSLWALRYEDFGGTIHFPSQVLDDYYPGIHSSWLNIYDRDDVLGYPLKPVNEAFNRVVTEDIQMNAGGLLTGWNPLSHLEYFKSDTIMKKIAASLAETWMTVNNI